MNNCLCSNEKHEHAPSFKQGTVKDKTNERNITLQIS